MTQEDKKLLLVDLCARLPYKVKIHGNFQWGSENEIFDDIQIKVLDIYDIDWFINNIEIKPYLFPLSSMTEWQERELEILMKNSIESCGMLFPYDCLKMERFFNENHLDWRGLIPKGLAIDCTNLNIY